MPKINIQPAHITEPAAGTVVLDNPVLRNLLVQNPAAAQHWLASKVAPVNASSITIDDQGRVVIADKAFAAAIAQKALAGGAAAAGDTACSNGACGAVNQFGGISELGDL